MMTAIAEVGFVTLEGVGVMSEERARADFYGLLANLFYCPPSAELLQSIRGAAILDTSVSGGSRFGARWRALQDAAQAADPAAIKQEYDDAFISTGRAPVPLFASFYLAGSPRQTPLTELREELARLGLALKASSGEPEDHISALCDVMRFLIVGGDGARPAALEAQRGFFTRHIGPWYGALCEAILAAGETDFYQHVARFAEGFFDLEVESLEIA